MKFDTKVTFIFVKDKEGNTGWAVATSIYDNIQLNVGTYTFIGAFVKLQEWVSEKGMEMVLEELEYTFTAAFGAGKFRDVAIGAQFTRESCGQRMIRITRDPNGMNAVCLHGNYAGYRYEIQEESDVRFINGNTPVER